MERILIGIIRPLRLTPLDGIRSFWDNEDVGDTISYFNREPGFEKEKKTHINQYVTNVIYCCLKKPKQKKIKRQVVNFLNYRPGHLHSVNNHPITLLIKRVKFVIFF